jgi:corrinoid protein of di/trimethylamine methyltransferase
MPSEERRQELLKGLYDAVVNYDEEASAELGRAILEEGIDAYDAVMNGLAAGMEKVGELFTSQEYFVPEVLLCADALYAGLNILRPHIKGEQMREKGQVVIGTVEGDVHDIGKNLVRMMFEIAGWTVHDLGKDVKLEKFVEEQMKTDSDVVALSALMTTSMSGIPKVIEMIKARNPNVAIMVGGAPITEDIAKSYGADGYAESAGNTVQEAIKMISQLRKR